MFDETGREDDVGPGLTWKGKAGFRFRLVSVADARGRRDRQGTLTEQGRDKDAMMEGECKAASSPVAVSTTDT
jgi:hypothetical protein